MTLIVCLDEHGGMTYNGRRQSRDGAVLEDIKRMGGRVLISPFSEKYFAKMDCTVCKDPLAEAGEGDLCFIEEPGAARYLERIDRIIIYNWNEAYPSDDKFDISPLKEASG